MAEIDLLVVFVIFVHREVDDPAEAEHPILDQAQLFANLCPRGACELVGVAFLAGREEDAVASPQTELLKKRREMGRFEILQHRILAVDTAAIGLF